MREIGKRYTDDFKKIIVEVYNTGKPIKKIYEKYGVNHVTFNWVNKRMAVLKRYLKSLIL